MIRPIKKILICDYFLKISYCVQAVIPAIIRAIKGRQTLLLQIFGELNNILPEMDDDTGTSLIYIHSKKGELIWSAVKQSVRYKATDVIAATKYNPSMLYSPKKPIVRPKIFCKSYR